MEERINYYKTLPEAVHAFAQGGKYLESCSLEAKLRYLIELRISQINGCSFCVDRHLQQLRKEGEIEQRLDCLVVWREAPFYTDKERAALAWAEAVTRIENASVSDALYDEMCSHFSEKELVELTFLVANMNLWNRVSVSLRHLPHKRG